MRFSLLLVVKEQRYMILYIKGTCAVKVDTASLLSSESHPIYSYANIMIIKCYAFYHTWHALELQ